MFRFRSAIACVVILVLATAMAACGDDDDSAESTATTAATGTTAAAEGGAMTEDELVAAAEEEGEVMVYWEMGDPVGANLVAAFNEKYPGVTATYFLGTSSVQIPKLDAEREQNLEGADIAYNSTTQWFNDRAAAGELLPIDDLPNAAAWEEATGQDLSGDIASIAISPFSLLWNTQVIDEPFESLEDLLRPELAGKLGTLDMVSPAAVLYYSHVFTQIDEDDVAAQGPWRLYPTSAPMIQAVAAGEIDATAFISTAAAKAAKDQGLPVDYVIPSDGGGTANKGGVLSHAKHPNAAKLWMNFILSPEGQEILVNNGTNISPMGSDEVSDSPDLPNLEIVDPIDLTEAEYQSLSQEYKQIFLQG